MCEFMFVEIGIIADISVGIWLVSVNYLFEYKLIILCFDDAFE